jgi:hypothetical protein
VILYMSPTGGGSQPDGTPNAAWDWRGRFDVPAAEGELGTLTTRVVYKKYISDEDCLDEYLTWTRSLPEQP